MTDKLQQICADKREHIRKLKVERPFGTLENEASAASPVRGFVKSLQTKITSSGIGLIAEIKKASPSAGLIRPDFNPAKYAKDYETGGAACLSVLTDEPYFQGCNEYLIAARAACSLPVLRKDFMIDVWQIAEARAIGADCVLLIMAAIDDTLAHDMHAAALHYGMDVLIEVHDHKEMDRALKLPSGLIGINNRNLKTLKIDLSTTEELSPMVPKDRIVVSESGLSCQADIKRMQSASVNCFLIGEALMRQEDLVEGTREILRK